MASALTWSISPASLGPLANRLAEKNRRDDCLGSFCFRVHCPSAGRDTRNRDTRRGASAGLGAHAARKELWRRGDTAYVTGGAVLAGALQRSSGGGRRRRSEPFSCGSSPWRRDWPSSVPRPRLPSPGIPRASSARPPGDCGARWPRSSPRLCWGSRACCSRCGADILSAMQLVDVLAILLVLAAAAAFVLGESALARAEDLDGPLLARCGRSVATGGGADRPARGQDMIGDRSKWRVVAVVVASGAGACGPRSIPAPTYGALRGRGRTRGRCARGRGAHCRSGPCSFRGAPDRHGRPGRGRPGRRGRRGGGLRPVPGRGMGYDGGARSAGAATRSRGSAVAGDCPPTTSSRGSRSFTPSCCARTACRRREPCSRRGRLRMRWRRHRRATSSWRAPGASRASFERASKRCPRSTPPGIRWTVRRSTWISPPRRLRCTR